MPFYPNAPHIDAANVASKLPEPLRKPAGMALQALLDMTGANDPASQVMGATGPLAMAKVPKLPGAQPLSEAARALRGMLNEFAAGGVDDGTKAAAEALQTFKGEKNLGRTFIPAPAPFKQPVEYGLEVPNRVLSEHAAFPATGRERMLVDDGYGEFGRNPEQSWRYEQQERGRQYNLGQNRAPNDVRGLNRWGALTQPEVPSIQVDRAPIARSIDELAYMGPTSSGPTPERRLTVKEMRVQRGERAQGPNSSTRKKAQQ